MHLISLFKKAVLASFTTLALFNTQAHADIKIGLALPFSGLYEPLGKQLLQGAELAVEKINATGGILSEKLILEPLDDKCSAETAKEIANQLVGKEVIAVIGHLCDRASIETSAIYAKNNIIQISPASQNPALTENRPNPNGGTYRLAPRSKQQADAIIDFLTSQPKSPSIALIDDGSTYGNALKENLASTLNEKGMKPVFTTRFKAGEEGYPILAGRLVDSGASHIVIAALHIDTSTLIRNLDKLSSKATILGGEGLAQSDFPRLVLEENPNRQTMQNIFISFPPDDRKHKEAAAIVKEFKQKNIRPVGLTLRGYSALHILSESIKKAGTKNFDALIEVLNKETFQTIIGKIRFNEKGDASLKGYQMHEWDNKSLKPLI